jgi:HD-GYP domain-containing protein (c-di-GMP phosphodiesterase class II)
MTRCGNCRWNTFVIADSGKDAQMLAGPRAALEMLSAAQRYRDAFTCKHADRVVDLAAAIAIRMDLPERRIEILRLAAMVHDIGKIGVPSEIVGKAGTLSEPEYALMKTHCAIGYDILTHLRSRFPIADIVVQHHERLDGSGYPQALSGNAILLEARILAVADVFDAMTSHRSYRAALSVDFVLAQIQAMAGRTLDADAVGSCTAHVLANPAASYVGAVAPAAHTRLG